MNPSQWHRRSVLQASGLSIALPGLESLADTDVASNQEDPEPRKAKRLVCIGTYLGFYQDAFFPKQSGRDYE